MSRVSRRALVALLMAVAAGCASTSARSAPPASTTTTTKSTPRSTTSRPAPPTTVARPPYPLAAVTLHLVDATRPTVSRGQTISASRALTTLVWFPARPGRWPLVVFAHGFQLGPSPYIPLLQAWAAHGYVVAAPEFPLTDAAVAGAYLDENDINQQPTDVRFVTDYLVGQSSPVRSHIDTARVAVAGHSDGAETALAAAAAPVPPGTPSYRAEIDMSAQTVTGAAGHNPPILVTQGTADTINPPSYGYQVYDQAASPRYLLVIEGGGHLPPLEPGSPWLPGIEAETEAFLDVYLAGDAPAKSLRPAVARSPGLVLDAG